MKCTSELVKDLQILKSYGVETVSITKILTMLENSDYRCEEPEKYSCRREHSHSCSRFVPISERQEKKSCRCSEPHYFD